MKILTLFLLTLCGTSLLAGTNYPLPKYPRKFSAKTRNIGPKPGSKVPENGPSSTVFKRVYYYPVGLRMMTRAKCSTKIGRQELLEKAQQISQPTGQPVQLDWENISNERVSYWVVTYARKITVTVNLINKDGRYVTGSQSQKEGEVWQVEKLSISKKGGICFKEEDLRNEDIHKAITNILVSATLRHYRSTAGS